jgi:hypothetical protein
MIRHKNFTGLPPIKGQNLLAPVKESMTESVVSELDLSSNSDEGSLKSYKETIHTFEAIFAAESNATEIVSWILIAED